MAADANGVLNRQTRASRLVAEALVEGHGPSQIVERAQELGIPRVLTNTVVAACCGQGSSASQQNDALRQANASGQCGCSE